MKFTRTSIPDVILCEPLVRGDDRGYFMETFRQDELETFLGNKLYFCQDNESKSSFGVLRGLHYQLAPYAQSKLVRVSKGEVLDVAVDIRRGSPTFGQHVTSILSEENKKQLFVPKGFAHGFAVLSDTAVLSYKVDNYYSPECDRGISYDDPNLGIDWQLPKDLLQLSEKDTKQPLLEEADCFEFDMNYMHKILVTGSKGQLGSELQDLESTYLAYSFFFTDLEELDITNHDTVKRFINENQITAIINCAAYTAVDKAEEDQELADKINHLAVENFATIAKDKGILLIHVSTDYVFDGTSCQPYKETDTPNPQGVYGKTKLDGELALQKINPANSIIIRTSWVYSSYGNNFMKTMLRLGKERDEIGVVYDQIGSPTYAGDLAKAILDILPQINNDGLELFHYANEGVCSWYDFAKAIFEIEDVQIKVKPLESFQFPLPAKRPFYSVLNKTDIKKTYQLDIPFWKESLLNLFSS